ncbi:lysophospholipid acyltransferase family protein [Sphaerisporangium sp. TRM90804]|uniref:lysophospholipid acyltransferase family protein n=1 Tax=Sphaerisporangium sp. TRM90804 TaxID=3031113 RepID=UPI00244B99D3|nr:lysophospholipid acyltransferase family protein [Sphaerisporangium sp. TRM90804]MDH2428483.1 lysophospholipid acyltransferase family protein [Sphaerisporangium sp. TRM90804]
MPEIVYPLVIGTARGLYKALGLKIDVRGAERVPKTGGAVLVSNHVSYLDFLFVGYGAVPARRMVRFMAKSEVFAHPVSGPLMRGMRHIPVDRSAGAGAYDRAVADLRKGELVGVFAEATISRSFTVKDIKNGAVRMASQAEVPLIPVAVWGTQRMWTKGGPRRLVQRGLPITVALGEPMYPKPGDDVAKVTADLRARMAEQLDHVQRDYPGTPPGVWWQPAHLGGTAPTPEQAAALDAAELEARRRARPGSGDGDPAAGI